MKLRSHVLSIAVTGIVAGVLARGAHLASAQPAAPTVSTAAPGSAPQPANPGAPTSGGTQSVQGAPVVAPPDRPPAATGAGSANVTSADPAKNKSTVGTEPGGAQDGKAVPAQAAGKPWYEQLADRPVDQKGTFWMPRNVNANAKDSDMMFYTVFALSAFFFIAIAGAVLYFVIKYRHRPGHRAEPSAAHNDALEVTWTVIPTLICVFLFYYGWRTYVRIVTPPQKALEVQVLAWQWNWQFTHQNGVQDSDLHVPVNTPIRLVMTSKDVLHSFYLPVMRIKQDIIPRRYTYAWFIADRPGTYRLSCAEYCGMNHSLMGMRADGRRAVIVVHPSGEYEQYLADKAEADGGANVPPAELGKKLYEQKGCVQCHALDGSIKVGPSFLHDFGTSYKLASGETQVVNEDYIRESILYPSAKARPGYPVGQMPSFEEQLKENQILGLIAFIKSLK